MKKNMTKITLLTTLCIAYAATTTPLFAKQLTHPTVRLGKIPALQKLQKLGKPKQNKADAATQASARVAKVKIDLSGQNITDENLVATLDAAIHQQLHGDRKAVQILNLSYNHLTTFPPNALNGLTNLRKLYLDKNTPRFTQQQKAAIKAHVKTIAPEARVYFN